MTKYNAHANPFPTYLRVSGAEPMSNPEELPVLFRMSSGGEVTAIFPTLPYFGGCVTCYAHIGQHGSASWQWVAEDTRPATEDEYAPLLAELRSIYENDPDEPVKLVVRKRRPSL